MTTITFRYFRDPHHFSTFTQNPSTCDICGRTLPGYEGPFYSEEDLDFVCEQCLASGRLAEHDATANEADRSTLYSQVKIANPNLSEEQVETLVNDKTIELEQRTPHIVTWQASAALMLSADEYQSPATATGVTSVVVSSSTV